MKPSKPGGSRLAWVAGAALLAVALLGKSRLDDKIEVAELRITVLEKRILETDGKVAEVTLDGRAMADRIGKIEEQAKASLNGTYRRINLGSTGSETCAAYGETCLGLRANATGEAVSKQFWGYSLGSCNSRVKIQPGCVPGLDFTLDKTEFRKHPDSKVQGDAVSGPLCLRQPYYEFAVCLVAPQPDYSTKPTGTQ
jgi:hypothetical protein